LLQWVKAHATRQGKTVTELVAEVLLKEVAEEKVGI